MTDLEISKALALAIGWKKRHIRVTHKGVLAAQQIPIGGGMWITNWRAFDYRYWNVIGPIAACCRLVVDFGDNSVCDEFCKYFYEADSPQKAIAMAVIKGTKK